MTKDQFSKLSVGDLVRHSSGSRRYVVMSNYGDHVTAVATVDMTNPSEWELVLKAEHTHVEASNDNN